MKMSESLKQSILDKTSNIKTLERQDRDSLDFHSLSVWQIEKMLELAFDAGLNAEK